MLLLGGGLCGTGPALAGIVRQVGPSRCRAFGDWLLRSNARFGPVPLQRFFAGALGKELLQNGDWVV